MRNRRPAVAYAPRVTVVVISMAVVVSLLPLPAHAQTGSRPDEWCFYGGGDTTEQLIALALPEGAG